MKALTPQVKKPLTSLKVVAFDLDDTLYSELDYVRSGLGHVALKLAKRFNINKQKFQSLLLESLKIGRSEIFDRVLTDIGCLNKANLKLCIQQYRKHNPTIHLYPKTLQVIKKLAENYTIYIVTDGHKLVQEKKLRALNLYDSDLIKKAYITYRYGIENSKPSPYCFNLICKAEKIAPEGVVYIADNAKKDFLGIKPLGFNTIRLNIGQHKDCFYSNAHEAEYVVDDLNGAIKLLAKL